MRYIGITSNTDLSGPQEISLYCISRRPLRTLFKEKKFPLSLKGSFLLFSLLEVRLLIGLLQSQRNSSEDPLNCISIIQEAALAGPFYFQDTLWLLRGDVVLESPFQVKKKALFCQPATDTCLKRHIKLIYRESSALCR